MRVRFKYGHWLPRLLRVDGITLYPWVLFKGGKEAVPGWMLDHEQVHVEQVKRDGLVRFLCVYVGDYVKGRWAGKSHHEAYRAIRYEVEAYAKFGG